MKVTESPTGYSLPVFFVFLLLSCTAGERVGKDQLAEFEMVRIEKKACVGEDCALVSISRPVFKDPRLQRQIDWIITQSLMFEPELDALALDTAVLGFLDRFLELKNDFPESNPWEYSMEAKVSHQSPYLLSIAFDSFSYTGGAHPNSFRTYLNHDVVKGTLVANTDLILDRSSLTTKAELAFREFHKVEDGKSLQEDGRFFLSEGGRFFLPEAIGFDGDDLVLFYNAYEIGPYSLGPSEIRLALSELGGVVSYAGTKP